MIITRTWAMPSRYTFDIIPIRQFVNKYLRKSKVSVDPFSGNKIMATYSNDLSPDSPAKYHLDAQVFLEHLKREKVQSDLVLFDPPYSPRQISECYKGIGLVATMKDTQNASLYKRVKDSLLPIISDRGVVLSFGWNTSGMGLKRGFEIVEILIVCHGGGHNDTLCVAETKSENLTTNMFDTNILINENKKECEK